MYAVAALVLELLAAAAPATCGWDPGFATDPVPPSVSSVFARLSAADSLATADARRLMQAWFERCDETSGLRAINELRNAHTRHRNNHAIAALHAISLARGPWVQLPRAAGYLYRPANQFSNSERDAMRLLVATARATRWPELADELAAIALASRNDKHVETAQQTIALLHDAIPGDANVAVALADVALARGDHRTVHALDRTLQSVPAGVRALAVARLRTETVPAPAAAQYLDALRRADRAALQRFYEDVHPLLTATEIDEWAALPDAARNEWLLKQWEWRASIAAMTLPERLAEHHKRLVTALTQYARVAYLRPDGALWLDSIAAQLPFDDRGLITIRHGEPDRVLRNSVVGYHRVAFAYFGVGRGNSVFEFVQSKGSVDYALARPITCEPWIYKYGKSGLAGEQAWKRGDPDSSVNWIRGFESDMLDYAADLAIYDPAIGTHHFSCVAAVKAGMRDGTTIDRLEWHKLRDLDRIATVQRQAYAALRTESVRTGITAPLRPLLSVYAFAGADATDVTAFVGMAGEGLIAAQQRADSALYALDITLSIENQQTRNVQRRDTTLQFGVRGTLPPQALVRASLTVNADSVPDAAVRVTVRNSAARTQGQIMVSTRAIPTLRRDRYGVSDLVIAAAADGAWRRGNVALAPLPGHALPQGMSFRLFYELYGTRADDALSTEIIIVPGESRTLMERLRELIERKEAVALTFADAAAPDADGVMRESREVQPNLAPGVYTVEVRVTNQRTGATTSNSTSLRIIPN